MSLSKPGCAVSCGALEVKKYSKRKFIIMANNPIPNAYPSLLVQLSRAYTGANNIGAGIPLLINTAALIGADRLALISAQADYKAARSALTPLSTARKAAVLAAYDFCFTTRDVIQFYCGREFNESWLAAGWTDNLEIPRSYDDLYTLTLTLIGYLAANPTQENTELGVTSAHAQSIFNALEAADTAVTNEEALVLTKREVRDQKLTAVRKRLSGLCKELSQRLEDMDPRWRQFGFNLPGAATVPAVPENVAVFALPLAKLQVSCDPSPNATSYKFYTQRPVLDPEPVLAGGADEPLFVTESLTAGQQYLVYVSAVNEGAESELSVPVSTTAHVAAAA